MVQAVSLRTPKIVADFAAGDGSLLQAAARQWPKTRLIGTDRRKEAVHALRRAQPTWSVGKCDFFSVPSRRQCKALRHLDGSGAEIILLNPPFSMRGGTVWKATVEREDVTCGRALAFLVTALPYLTADGIVVAVLPSSALTSQRDGAAWDLLGKHWKREIIAERDRTTFRDCYPRTVVVKLTRRSNGCRPKVLPSKEMRKLGKSPARIDIVRGTTQLHRSEVTSGDCPRGAIPLVHSTELRRNELLHPRFFGRFEDATTAPLVLIPRVGRFRPEKVVLYESRDPIVLSDCVIGLSCASVDAARSLFTSLVDNARVLASCYRGTCAPYLTLETLAAFLAGLGYTASHAYLDQR